MRTPPRLAAPRSKRTLGPTRGTLVGLALCSLLAAAASGGGPSRGQQPTAADVASPAPPDDSLVKALAILLQVSSSLEDEVRSGELGQVHHEDMFLYPALSRLMNGQPAERNNELRALARGVADLHAAADAFDRTRAQAAFPSLAKAFQAAWSVYDAPTLARAQEMAGRFACPMHSSVVGKRNESCSKCGMPLDVRVRVSLQALSGSPVTRYVQASLQLQSPLEVGHPADALLKLSTVFGDPLPWKDLREVHTRKIHLLVIDGSLTDYHHEHPAPTDAPGEYRFTFTPRKPGPYRAWADVLPLVTGFQEYAVTDIPAPGASRAIEKTLAAVSEHEGLRYELVLAEPAIRSGRPTSARVNITRAGKPFASLEPLMGAFAHLVGFHEDRGTVLHVHPVQSRALLPADRGGPELEFRLYAEAPGFYRFFLQVQIAGESRFVPFGLEVAP